MSKHTQKAHIEKHRSALPFPKPLFIAQQLQLDSIDNYVYCRQLRWVGHVSRMPFDRLPRRMLSSWVAAKRPSGGQLMTYGRSVSKALDNFGIDRDSWHALAADRPAWRAALHGSLRRVRLLPPPTSASPPA